MIDLTKADERPSLQRHPTGNPTCSNGAAADSSPDAVLRRCEQISANLRSALGSQEGDRCASSASRVGCKV